MHKGDDELLGIVGIGGNHELILASKPSKSGVYFFVFELGDFFELLYTESVCDVECLPYLAGVVADFFCVHVCNI